MQGSGPVRDLGTAEHVAIGPAWWLVDGADRLENLPLLTARDQVKFVLCGRADYEWARGMLAEHRLAERCDVLFSPSKSELSPRELADWIVSERLPVRFQMQLHKLLWNDEPGR